MLRIVFFLFLAMLQTPCDESATAKLPTGGRWQVDMLDAGAYYPPSVSSNGSGMSNAGLATGPLISTGET